MKTSLSPALSLAALFAWLATPAPLPGGIVFSNGFETYPANANIQGQAVGNTTWSTAGVLTGDQALISTTTPLAGGAQSLMIADNGANAPRASVNLINGGFVASPIAAGSVVFYIREDSADSGTDDLFKVSAGNLIVQRDSTDRIFFNNSQGGTTKTFNFTGTNYTYTPGSWTRFEIVFDNALKAADLYINDGYAGTITGTTQDFSVSGITVGAYNTGSTGDKIYYDGLEASISGYANDFESYASGASIQSLPSGTGTGTWTTTGVLAGDQATVSSAYSYDGGGRCILLADNGGNLPRASLNFINIGLIQTAASQGEISYTVMEDPTDGADDGFFATLNGMTITRDVTKQNIQFTVTGSPYGLQFPYNTDGYTYAPGQWNTFKVRFDNVAKTADLYINGAYAATQSLPVGGSADFSVAQLTLSGSRSGAASVGDKIYYDEITASFTPPATPSPWRSSLYPANWTPGFSDAEGRSLQDFSYAGYKSGSAQIPNITGPIYNVVTGYGADSSGAADSTAAIQNAINAAGTAGGGVVYLPAGTYKVAPIGANAAALSISKSNIVLRGAGTGQTFLFCSNPVMKNKQVISIKGTTAMDWYNGSAAVNLTSDLEIGDTNVPVTSTGSFNVGDLIVVRNDLTQAFIDSIGNTGFPGWTSPGSNYPNRMLAFCRRVVSKTSTSLTVDVPLRYPVKVSDNGRVFKPSAPMLQEVGLEDFSIGMQETTGPLGENDWNVPGTGGYNADRSTAVAIIGAENCWIERVNSYKPAGNATCHILSNGISVDKCRRITIDSCDFRLAQYKGANGNGYHFTISSQEVLVQDCRAEAGRHNLSIDHMYSCGNVFLRLYLKDSQNDSDFHQFLSMSNLLDNTTCDGEMLESRLRTEVSSPTPGWTSTESVFWNTLGLRYAEHDTQNSLSTKGLRIIQSYQWGHGYVIGTQGPCYAVTSTNFVEGIGAGAQLVPSSLYLDQRLKRLGY